MLERLSAEAVVKFNLIVQSVVDNSINPSQGSLAEELVQFASNHLWDIVFAIGLMILGAFLQQVFDNASRRRR